MLWMVLGLTVPFEGVTCADDAATNPATRAKDATKFLRFMASPPDHRKRSQRDIPTTSRPKVRTRPWRRAASSWTVGDAPWRRAIVSVPGAWPFELNAC